jgi:hypothetical protein
LVATSAPKPIRNFGSMRRSPSGPLWWADWSGICRPQSPTANCLCQDVEIIAAWMVVHPEGDRWYWWLLLRYRRGNHQYSYQSST